MINTLNAVNFSYSLIPFLISKFKLQSHNQPYYRENSFMVEELVDNEKIISLGSGFGKY